MFTRVYRGFGDKFRIQTVCQRKHLFKLVFRARIKGAVQAACCRQLCELLFGGKGVRVSAWKSFCLNDWNKLVFAIFISFLISNIH